MGASQLEGVGDTSKLPAPQLEKGVRWAVWAAHGLCYSEITADRVSEAMNNVCLSFLLHTMGLLVWYVAQAGLQLTK